MYETNFFEPVGCMDFASFFSPRDTTSDGNLNFLELTFFFIFLLPYKQSNLMLRVSRGTRSISLKNNPGVVVVIAK